MLASAALHAPLERTVDQQHSDPLAKE